VNKAFWQRLTSEQLGNFHNEFLIACSTFETDWPMWEMHPNGDEVVCLLSGSATFLLETVHGTEEIALNRTGTYVLYQRAHGTRPRPRARVGCSSSRQVEVRSIERRCERLLRLT
jgi:hypothetical protein